MATTEDSSNRGEITTQEALAKLAAYAEVLIEAEQEKDWLPLMRNKAAELGVELDVKDPNLERYLDDAERALRPAKVYRGGEALQASEPSFLLDGLIQLGETNMIVGQPKVGKSSFMVGFAAALRDRRETFLGRDIALPSERMPVLLFGTDQSEGNWLHFLKRERLVGEDQVLDSNAIDFFCDIDSSDEFNFTKEGLRHMREEIEKHQFPLVIIDSLNSMMEPTGLEENNSRYAQPIRNAIRELRKTGATLVIIHHTRKSPLTWDWIAECRGSSSIASVMSWGVLMRWVSQEEEGLMRIDKRVGFAGKGRGSGESGGAMAEYLADGGWTFLDGLEAAQQVERMGRKIAELGGVRASVFDYVCQRHEVGADVCSEEASVELNKHKNAVSREMRILMGRGLVSLVRKEGQRPYYSLSPASAEWMDMGSSREPDPVFRVSPVYLSKENKKNKETNSRYEEQAERKTSLVSTPVERLIDGEWVNGWIVHDDSDPHKVVIAKIGNPLLRISNQRWDIDIRPCESPFANSTATEVEW